MGNRKNNSRNQSPARGDIASALEEIKTRIGKEAEVSKERYESILDKLVALNEENKKLKGHVEKLSKKVEDQDLQIHVLTNQMNNLHQDKINNNVVVKGVPEVGMNENLFSFAMCLMRELSVSVKEHEIVNVKRMGQPMADKKRPIVITFSNNATKFKVIRAKRRVELNADLFSMAEKPIGSKEDKIFIDEHLTRSNMSLFMEARKLRAAGVKFVWTHNGAVLTKFEEKSRVIRIRDYDELSNQFLKLHMKPAAKRKEISPIIHSTPTSGSGKGVPSVRNEAKGEVSPEGKRPRHMIDLSKEINDNIEQFGERIQAITDANLESRMSLDQETE